MSFQGPLSPTVVTPVASGTVIWSNPDNIMASDDAKATASLTLSQTSRVLKPNTFGFSIPSNAQITGLLVEVERSATLSPGIKDSLINLVDTGTHFVGNDKATTDDWPTSDAYASYGGDGDLWGATLTPDMINGSGFGVAVQALCGVASIASIDHVRMTVFYENKSKFQSQAGNRRFSAGGMGQVDFIP